MENIITEHLIIAGIERSPILKHYGSKKYIKEKVFPVKNDNWVKPKKECGLWTSPIDSQWGWKDWNEMENFRDCNESNSFIVKLKESAKILVIDSFEDLKNAPLIKGSFNHIFLDFEIISKLYDAIWLTEEGEKKTRSFSGISLYGWDCETVFILNPNCCIEI